MSIENDGKEYITLEELAELLMTSSLTVNNCGSPASPLNPIMIDGKQHWDKEAVNKKLAEIAEFTKV